MQWITVTNASLYKPHGFSEDKSTQTGEQTHVTVVKSTVYQCREQGVCSSISERAFDEMQLVKTKDADTDNVTDVLLQWQLQHHRHDQPAV